LATRLNGGPCRPGSVLGGLDARGFRVVERGGPVDLRGGVDGHQGTVAPGLHVRRDRQARWPGLADGEALSGARRAGCVSPPAEAVQAARVQAADRSVARQGAAPVGRPGFIRIWFAITGSTAAMTRCGGMSSALVRGRRGGRKSGLRPRPGSRRRSTGPTKSRSARAPASSCRSTASTWCSAIRATRSAR
jgi:hypothetical protein